MIGDTVLFSELLGLLFVLATGLWFGLEPRRVQYRTRFSKESRFALD